MSDYDIQYKQGEKDTANAVLSQNGNLIDLTPYTVTFVMINTQTNVVKGPITCTLGCTYKGEYYSGARGGVQIPFSDVDTADSGLFHGEWVLTSSNSISRVPSGENYVQIKIWEKVA